MSTGWMLTLAPTQELRRLACDFFAFYSCIFPLRGERLEVRGVARQGKRGSASQRHAAARQAVEIRAMSSVENAHGMTIKGQQLGSEGVGRKLSASSFFGGL